MEYLFWISLFLVFHAYFGYPLSLRLFSVFKRHAIIKATIEPSVTLIITVCNEDKRIKEKLDNTLAIEYPRDKLQILIASDGSTDKTNDIVREYANYNMHLLVFDERRGKENAQKDAVSYANGEIIIFSDVATNIDSQGIKEIVSSFADPTVGSVSSVDKLIDRNGQPCGEGFYVKYEMWLRDLESRANSLVGLSGSFFAARKEVCQDFSGEMQSDFRTLLNSIKLGLRGISDPATIGYYQDLSDNKREFDRKVRTVLRGMTVFFRNLEFLNLFRYRLFSYQYFCHKLLRWMVPFLLCFIFIANAAVINDAFIYFMLFTLQISFYAIAITCSFYEGLTSHTLTKIPVYFTTVNIAILVAWWRYLKGVRMVMWSPSER